MANIIPVFLSYAGCPHRCAFCNQQVINRMPNFSLLQVQTQVEKYLTYFAKKAPKELAFYGGSFTGLPLAEQKQLLNYAENLRKQGIINKIRLSTRPDYINSEIAQLLKTFPVSLVELGVQSLDDKVLERAKRGHTAQTVEAAVAILQAQQISYGLQLMTGLPGQDWDSIRQTTEKALQLKPATIRLYPFVVLQETEFAKEYLAGKLPLLDFATVVEQTAYMAEKFTEAKIKLLRIGLQEDEGLQAEGAILAGFHHPAFGELVAAYLYRKKLENLIKKSRQQKITVLVPGRELSQALGHKKSNLAYFAKIYPAKQIKIKAAQCLEPYLEFEG